MQFFLDPHDQNLHNNFIIYNKKHMCSSIPMISLFIHSKELIGSTLSYAPLPFFQSRTYHEPYIRD